MATNPDTPLLTVPEVALRLNVNPVTVRRWIGDGVLPAVKVRRNYRVDPAQLDALLRRSQALTVR